MKMYKEINRVIKNYVALKYNSGLEYRKDVDEFKQYLSDLLDALKKNNLIGEYSLLPATGWEVPGFIQFTLTYSIYNSDNIFAMDFAI